MKPQAKYLHRRRTIPALLAAGALMAACWPVSMAHSQGTAEVMRTDSQSLSVEVNKGLLLRLDTPATDVFIANPAVADIQVKSPTLIYVLGKQTGETSIYAMGQGERMIYSASIHVMQNLERLNDAIARLLPEAAVEVQSANGTVILTGYVDSPEEAAIAVRLTEQMTGQAERLIDRLKITTPRQVNLRVKFAEMGRDVVKTLGFNWESAFSNSDVFFGLATGLDVFDIIDDPVTGLPLKQFSTLNNGTNSLVGSVTTGNFDLNTVIDALESEGFLSVLAEPNLTAISGESANFLAGGEFPIPVPDEGDISIQFKEFGVSLTFVPTVLSDEKINLKIMPEVSQLSSNGAISINGISVPAITTRRAETTIELGSGQSFAVAGLIQNNITQDVSKTPGLADIPILGALFKSDRFRRQETELVIIATPYIVRPVSERQIAIPNENYRPPNDFDRYLRGQTYKTDPAPMPGAANDTKGRKLIGKAGFKLN